MISMTAEYRIRHGVPHDVPGHTVAPRPRSVATPVHGTAVQRKPGCACGGGCPRCRAARTQEAAHGMVQTKFAVNHPDDAHEQEANRVADRVMRMPDPGSAQPAAVAARAAGSVQRTCSSCEAGQEEAMVQAKERRGQVPSVTPAVQRSIDSMRGGGRPLPAAERAFFEPRFGHDFADVRIHDGESAGSSAASLNARAFTVGRDVVFGAGEYSPGSVQGRYLLAHELTHVLQQSAGGAPGTIARKPAAEEEKKTAKPRAPRCDTGCAQRWGQDTTCSKWGFFQGLGEHTTDRKWESFACCNSWPLSVETWARTQLGLAGAASCTARHQREIATVSFGGNEVDILCSDTIPTDKFGQKQLSTGACTGTIDEEVIELSPKAMQDLSGQLANALPVRVCYSGTKVDMCLHNGPGARSFPTPQQCLTRGCPVDEDTPSHADSGWPRV